jgi:hypothetical protein
VDEIIDSRHCGRMDGNSLCAGWAMALNMTSGSWQANSTIVKPSTAGIRIVVTDLARCSFSMVVLQ